MARDCREEGLPPTVPLLHDSENDNSASSATDSCITPVLLLSTSVAVCSSFCYGFSVGYSSPTEYGIMKDLGLSLAAYSVFGSIMTIGGMVGAILSGKMADLIGRKKTMWLSQIVCTLGWLAIAFAKDVWWLDFGRLSNGFGVGLVTYVVPVYIAEIAPKNLRGRFTSANSWMISTGFTVAYVIGNFVSWRDMSLLGSIPCLMQIIGLFFIPESPRWLATLGRKNEFEAALQRLRGKNADISQEAIDITETIEAFQKNGEARILELFQRRYAYPLFVGVGLMALQQFGGISAVLFYLSSLFTKAHFSNVIGTSLLGLLQVPSAITGLLLMDMYGRRTILMVSSTGMCSCLLIVVVSSYLQELQYLKGITPIMDFIAFTGYTATFTLGMAGIPWVIMSEIFPMNIKASAGSIVTLTNWSCSWIATYTFNFMLEWSSTGTFLIYTGICGLTVVFIWKLVPETKGRTLEEIQEQITHFW